MASPRTISSWILVIVLACLFALSALGKLTGAASPMFEGWGYPAWFALLIGCAELAGAIGLLVPKTTRWAVYGLSAVMIGAAFTHLSNGEGMQVLRPLIFLGGLWAIWLLRRPATQSSSQ